MARLGRVPQAGDAVEHGLHRIDGARWWTGAGSAGCGSTWRRCRRVAELEQVARGSVARRRSRHGTMTPMPDADPTPALPPARPRVLSGIQPTAGLLPPRQLPRRDPAVGWRCRRTSTPSSSSPTCTRSPWSRTPRSCASLRRRAAAQLIATGVDPERSTIFLQSHVPAHAQLGWVLQCLTGFGEARRMTQFKDKSAKGGEGAARVGLFTYPILQAADILLYRPTICAGRRGPAPAPRAHPRPRPALQHPLQEDVPAARSRTSSRRPRRSSTCRSPTAKMSKSASSPDGIVDLLDDPKASAKKIRSAVTDSETEVRFDRGAKPGVSNLLTIYSALTGDSVEALVEKYAGRGYGDLKGDLAEVVVEFVTPFRTRTLELLDDPASSTRSCAAGAERANEVAERTLADVYERVGFVRPPPHRPRRLQAVRAAMTTIGVSVAVPDPWGAELQGYRDRGSVTPQPRRHPHPHHAAAADRRRRRRCCPRSTSTWRARPPRTATFPVQLRGTGTFRPVSPVVFVNVVAGHLGLRAAGRRGAHGPAGDRRGVPLPPSRHGRPPPRRRPAGPRVRRALPASTCGFAVDHFVLYHHLDDHGWVPVRDYPADRSAGGAGLSMCGIAVVHDPAGPDPCAGERMLARLRHRGPDGDGTRVVGPTWLGHTRLSIVDLDGGGQPLADGPGDGGWSPTARSTTTRSCATLAGPFRHRLRLRGRAARAGRARRRRGASTSCAACGPSPSPTRTATSGWPATRSG